MMTDNNDDWLLISYLNPSQEDIDSYDIIEEILPIPHVLKVRIDIRLGEQPFNQIGYSQVAINTERYTNNRDLKTKQNKRNHFY